MHANGKLQGSQSLNGRNRIAEYVEDPEPAADLDERRYLSGLILYPELIAEVSVRPADFRDPDLAALYRQLRQRAAAGLPVDAVALAVALAHALKQASDFKAGGGDAHVLLADIATFVPRHHVAHHAAAIIDASRRRTLAITLRTTMNGLAGKHAAETIAALKTTLAELSDDDATEPTTAQKFERFAESITSREKPKLFAHAPYGSRRRGFEIGEGQLILEGGQPGAGKTAHACQVGFDALQYPGQEHLKMLVVNVEMSPDALWTRQLARESGVGYAWLRHRDYDPSAADRIEDGLEVLRGMMDRVEFLPPPYTWEHTRQRARAFGANIVILDYIQRIDSENRSSDARAQMTAAMDHARRLADEGRAILAVSAVNRQGYARDTASIASFRESSEAEYACDAAWLLIADEKNRESVALKCVKNRFGKLDEIPLTFHAQHMYFTDDAAGQEWNG